MERTGRVQSIERAIAIIKLFNENRLEMKLSDIAEELDLNKSTVHGIISTLKYHGIIDQDEETQKYRLGLYNMVLGEMVQKSLNIRNITTPIIDRVSAQLNETIHIATLEDNEVVYINKKESTQSMRIYTQIGARNPAHCTGVGKAMLAYNDLDTLKNTLPEKLDSLTPYTITDKADLIKELIKIRQQEYSIDNEENSIGLTCVAAPIFDHKGVAKYGISISGPTVRMTEEKIQESIRVIKDAAEEISHKLGYK